MSGPVTVGLTQPRRRSRTGVVSLAAAGIAFGSLVLLVYGWGKTPLPPVPIISTVHAVAMAVICATTAALLLTHAKASGERGYLILGGTFAYVCGVMVLFPFVYPNGIQATDPPSVMWGTLQSSATLFHPWHLMMIIGVTAAAVVLGRDQRAGRPPGLRHGMALTLGSVLVALGLTALVTGVLIDHLPPVVEGIQATAFAVAMFRIEAALALVGTIVVARECRDGSMISRWLLAVMVVTLGEAVTMLNADRYSLAWYYNRVIGLVAAIILLGVLISDLARIERVTKSLVDTDALTGAASRAAVLAAIARESRRVLHTGATACLVWVDIDAFREVNERLGSQVGDRILVEARARIQGEVGPTDIVGRVGGDEFAIVVTGIDRNGAELLAQRLLAVLSEPFQLMESVVVLTASIGLVSSDDVTADPQTVVRSATVGMQAAKEAGGNRFAWFSPALGADAVERAHLRHALIEAIRDRDFTLAYQPIVDLGTGEVAGAEALVRWEREGRSHEAAQFIAFAEESGLIVGIGRLVTESLARDVPQLLDAVDETFVLTFNLSVKELADDEIVEALLRGVLRQRSNRLIVEVTESFELHGDTRAAANLDRLRAGGYRTAVDDFGAGYSNFARLVELQPAVVKIDRSIVVRAGAGSAEGLATMQATTDIARALRARVLAEGVESNDEAEATIRMGIDLAQGYRYARPMDRDSLIAFWSGRAVPQRRVIPESEETPQG